MRLGSTFLNSLLASAGPFIGENRAHGRLTVQPDWYLHTAFDVATPDTSKLPFRWWQDEAGSQVEVEVPNVKSINWDRSLDSDAASCTITFYNTKELLPAVAGNPRLGTRGHLTWRQRGMNAMARWPENDDEWADILVPDALLRSYEGWGGHGKTITQAVADGQLFITGVWLVDTVDVGTDGNLVIQARDMAKLLIEQPLYPPLFPVAKVPLHYARFINSYTEYPAVPVYDSTNPVELGPGAEGPKYVPDIGVDADGDGYVILGSDGAAFAYSALFFGSRGGVTEDAAPMRGLAMDPLGRGYWMCAEDGAVFAFGEAGYYGRVTSPAAPIGSIVATHTGRGYWLLGEDGGVFAFGDAIYAGGGTATGKTFVDMARDSGGGYWLLADDGSIYSYGGAVYYGGASIVGPTVWTRAAALIARPQGDGYWIVRGDGTIGAFGAANGVTAQPAGDWETARAVLNDPIFSGDASPSGLGFVIVGGDGGVFAFGDAPFRGSLPGPYARYERLPGDYVDLNEIARDLLLWSGWLLYGADVSGIDGGVFGNIELSGTYVQDELGSEVFTNKYVIDVIRTLREVTGMLFFIDEEGGANLVSPNWHTYGNTLQETGLPVAEIPDIDERLTLTQYRLSYSGKPLRSDIIITSLDSAPGNDTTVTTTRHVTTDLDRGILRPVGIGTPFQVSKADQEVMAELVEQHIHFQMLQGSLTCIANPRLQCNDQVRIYEQVSGETDVHHIRSISSSHDLDTGQWMYSIQTSRLGAGRTATSADITAVPAVVT